MENNAYLLERFELRHATTLSGRMHFSSEGGPLNGLLALDAPGSRRWEGTLSESALNASEARWSAMPEVENSPGDAALLLTRLAVAHDTDFYGLAVDWNSTELLLSPTGGVVRFLAPVRWTDLLDVAVCARRCGSSSRGTEG